MCSIWPLFRQLVAPHGGQAAQPTAPPGEFRPLLFRFVPNFPSSFFFLFLCRFIFPLPFCSKSRPFRTQVKRLSRMHHKVRTFSAQLFPSVPRVHSFRFLLLAPFSPLTLSLETVTVPDGVQAAQPTAPPPGGRSFRSTRSVPFRSISLLVPLLFLHSFPAQLFAQDSGNSARRQSHSADCTTRQILVPLPFRFGLSKKRAIRDAGQLDI